jgi:hypothetical protein
MRWAGQVAPRSMRNVFWWRSLKKRAYLDYLSLGRIILKQILKKQNGRTWTGANCLRIRYVAGCIDKVMNRQVPYSAGNFSSS